jgi:mRNA-degrading endonuclease toxin of MazEF toxin-antitoxin module
MNYNNLRDIQDKDKSTLNAMFSGIIDSLKHVSINKISNIIRYIPDICRLHHLSCENRKLRNSHKKKYHPVKVFRGEIYNAIITEGVGSELSGNHLVIIMQNKKGNIYGEKVNVLPIEGDGTRINPNYQMRLSNEHLKYGSLDKDPSRIIITDIMTLDKARLDRKIGQIKPEYMLKISKMLKSQLEL